MITVGYQEHILPEQGVCLKRVQATRVCPVSSHNAAPPAGWQIWTSAVRTKYTV